MPLNDLKHVSVESAISAACAVICDTCVVAGRRRFGSRLSSLRSASSHECPHRGGVHQALSMQCLDDLLSGRLGYFVLLGQRGDGRQPVTRRQVARCDPGPVDISYLPPRGYRPVSLDHHPKLRKYPVLADRAVHGSTRAYTCLVRYLSDHLPVLRAEFPAYTFTIAQTWYGVSFVASRTGAGDGPLVVITADVDELRECLAPQTRTR